MFHVAESAALVRITLPDPDDSTRFEKWKR